MGVLNWTVIQSNLAEAREQLEELERQLEGGSLPSVEEFEIQIQHVFHHVNFAWNARFIPTATYRNLSDAQFHEWGAYPADLETL